MLVSLEHQSGLPIAFDPAKNSISWPEEIIAAKTSARTFPEMRGFIAESDATSTGDPVYTVYRNINRREDEAAIRSAGLRYDITIIPPGFFTKERKEYFRTAGHYHPLKPGTAVAYPEVFEVISGRAYWLLQRPKSDDNAVIEEIYAVEAGPGEKAMMLPGFGHISINAYDQPLVMANWIGNAFQYDYAPYQRFRGGGYWVMEGPTAGTIEFERNSRYREVGELKKLRPKEVPELGLLRSQPLYSLVNELEKLRFLNTPEEFRDILTIERCYRQL